MAKLIELAQEGRGKGEPPITSETRIGDIADLDSLAVVEFYMMFEDEFRVSLPENLMTRDRTLAEIARIIFESRS